MKPWLHAHCDREKVKLGISPDEHRNNPIVTTWEPRETAVRQLKDMARGRAVAEAAKSSPQQREVVGFADLIRSIVLEVAGARGGAEDGVRGGSSWKSPRTV